MSEKIPRMNRKMFKQLVRLAYHEPDTQKRLVPFLMKFADGSGSFEELYEKRQKKVQEEEKAEEELKAKKKKEEEDARAAQKKKTEDETEQKKKKETSKSAWGDLLKDTNRFAAGEVAGTFNKYYPDQKDLLDFMESQSDAVIPSYTTSEEVIDLVDNISAMKSEKFKSGLFELMRRLHPGNLLQKNLGDIAKFTLGTMSNWVKDQAKDSQWAKSLNDWGWVDMNKRVNTDIFEKMHRGWLTLPETVSRLGSGKAPEEYKSGFWNKVKATLTVGPWKEKFKTVDYKKFDFNDDVSSYYFNDYISDNQDKIKKNSSEHIQKFLDENKEDLSNFIKEQTTKALKGEKLQTSKNKSGIPMSEDNLKSVIQQSITNSIQKKVSKLKDPQKSELLASIEDVDFNDTIKSLGTQISTEIKPSIHTESKSSFLGIPTQHFADVPGILRGEYEGKNFGGGSRVEDFRSQLNTLASKSKAKREGNKFRSKNKDKGKGKKDTFEAFVAKKNDAGGFHKKETDNYVNFKSLSVDDQKKIRKQWDAGGFKSKKGSKKKMSFIQGTIRIAHAHQEFRSALLPLLQESQDPNTLFKGLVRLAHSNEAFRPHFLRMVQAKNLPADVERYVQEGKDQGMDESKAWAVAWSRFCQYKDPGSDHCKQDNYFQGQKSASFLRPGYSIEIRPVHTKTNPNGYPEGRATIVKVTPAGIDLEMNGTHIFVPTADTKAVLNPRSIWFPTVKSAATMYGPADKGSTQRKWDMHKAIRGNTGGGALTQEEIQNYYKQSNEETQGQPVEFLDSISTTINDQMFSQAVKVTHANPAMRPQMLPLLTKYAQQMIGPPPKREPAGNGAKIQKILDQQTKSLKEYEKLQRELSGLLESPLTEATSKKMLSVQKKMEGVLQETSDLGEELLKLQREDLKRLGGKTASDLGAWNGKEGKFYKLNFAYGNAAYLAPTTLTNNGVTGIQVTWDDGKASKAVQKSHRKPLTGFKEVEKEDMPPAVIKRFEAKGL